MTGVSSAPETLTQAIQRRAHLRSEDEAKHALQGVLQALAHVLPSDEADVICGCVPDDLVWCMRCGPGTPDPLIDSEVFLGWVMSSLDATAGQDQTLGGEVSLAALAADEVRGRARVVLDEIISRAGPLVNVTEWCARLEATR